MANERLRTALLQRGLTPSELADTVGVDPKTIERWIGGRIPYRRHRHQVAVRLGVDETYLWPGALAAEQVASASESEILVVYPHRWAVPRDTWGLLFDSAEQEIGILVYSGMFLADDPGLLALFRAKAEQGVRVRILLGDPDSPEVAAAASTRASTTRWPPRSATRPSLLRPLRTGRGRDPPARDRALQLDLPCRRRAAGQRARLRHAGRAGAGDAPAPDRRWHAGRHLPGQLRAGLGRSPDPD